MHMFGERKENVIIFVIYLLNYYFLFVLIKDNNK